MIVAIGGPIGVGKSTVARGLATRLGYKYISGGEVFREVARARGISIVEVNKLAEEDPALDREVDRRQRELARGGNCVVESRLSGWMVDDADIRIWLRAPIEVRAARVSQREGQDPAEAQAEFVERERSEWSRYKALYGIDMSDLSVYDLVIDTARWNAEVIVDALTGLVRAVER